MNFEVLTAEQPVALAVLRPDLNEDEDGGAVAETESGARWPSGIEHWLTLATGRCWSGSNPTAENFAWCLCQGK